jgi:hypothetical protein
VWLLVLVRSHCFYLVHRPAAPPAPHFAHTRLQKWFACVAPRGAIVLQLFLKVCVLSMYITHTALLWKEWEWMCRVSVCVCFSCFPSHVWCGEIGNFVCQRERGVWVCVVWFWNGAFVKQNSSLRFGRLKWKWSAYWWREGLKKIGKWWKWFLPELSRDYRRVSCPQTSEGEACNKLLWY